MSEPNPYAFLIPIAMKHYLDQKAAEKAPQKPYLTLVSTTERTFEMEPSKPEKNDTNQQQSARARSICLMANGKPLAEHGAFDDLGAAAWQLMQGAGALKCIGQLIQPQTDEDGKEALPANQENMAHLFNFFGDALMEYGTTVNEASFRIAQVARGFAD